MSDILADYREWQSQQEERIGTHSDDCHMWPRHERCMIHRLAREVERLRLTDEEREALTVMMGDSRRWGEPTSQIVRGLLERLSQAGKSNAASVGNATTEQS